ASAVDGALAAGLDGLVIGNTTISREGVQSAQRGEPGGLSGRPLYHRSTVMLAKARKLSGRDAVLIGVGGIDSPETAWQKLAAGADLVQLYTGMIYEGPGLPAQINAALASRLERGGISTIGEIVGSDVDRWAAMTP